MGDRGVGVGGGIGLLVAGAWLVGLEEGEVIERDFDLPLSCIVWFALLRLEETAATGVATAAESAETAISLTVLAATSAFCGPEAGLGDASTTLTGAISCVLGCLARFIGRV